MNPLAWLNPGRWLLYGGLMLAIVAGALVYKARIESAADAAGYARAQAEYTAAALKAEQAARAREAQLNAARAAVEKTYVTEKRRAADAAAAAQSELDLLRDTLDSIAAGRAAAADPGTAGRADGPARLEQELLGHCARALVDLAREADGLEARIVGLQGYVRDVCQAQRR